MRKQEAKEGRSFVTEVDFIILGHFIDSIFRRSFRSGKRGEEKGTVVSTIGRTDRNALNSGTDE